MSVATFIPFIAMYAIGFAANAGPSSQKQAKPQLGYRSFIKMNEPGLEPKYTLYAAIRLQQFLRVRELLVFDGKKRIAVASKPEDLKGYFKIDSSAKALAFVRLFSNQFTFDLCGADAVEVISDAKVDQSYCIQDVPGSADALRSSPDGSRGVVTAATAKNIGALPTVVQTGSTFVVTRILTTICYANYAEDSHLIRRVESVGPIGDYKLLSEKRIPDDPNVHIFFRYNPY